MQSCTVCRDMKLSKSGTSKAHLNSTRSTHALVGDRQGRAQLAPYSSASFDSMTLSEQVYGTVEQLQGQRGAC